MKTLATFLLAIIFCLPAFAQDEEDEKKKIQIGKTKQEKIDALIVSTLESIDGMDDPENVIPFSLVRKSEGIIIFPKAIKTSIGMGGQSGRGIAMIRKGGGWSNPYIIKLQEISGGLQFGVQISEIIILVKNADFIRDLEKADMQIGADVNATAGPDGTNMAMDANPDLGADLLTYQKSKGLFGGASLSGGALIYLKNLSEEMYGEGATVDSILKMKTPYDKSVQKVHHALSKMGV